jgi:P4 family phage/plasmid primase-like protien
MLWQNAFAGYSVAAFGRDGKAVSHLMVRQKDGRTRKFRDPITRDTLLEVRGNGLQTLAPPSIHTSGEVLTWLPGFSAANLTVDPTEEQVAERIAGMVLIPVLLKAYWVKSTRNDLALSIAGYLLNSGWPEDQVKSVVMAAATLAGDEEARTRQEVVGSTARKLENKESIQGYGGLRDLLPKEVLAKVEQAVGISQKAVPYFYVNGTSGVGPSYPRTPNTEVGNKDLLYEAVASKVIYVPELKRWYIWKETHWQEDIRLEMVALAMQSARSIYDELSHIADDTTKRGRFMWAMASEMRTRLEATVALLRSEERVIRLAAELDQHPMLLPVVNGVIDLTTGDLSEGNPDNLLTKCLDVTYDPYAECPVWEKFLQRIMAGDEEKIRFIQRLIGHTLTGDTSGKYLVFLYGQGGDNGKSTMVETMLRLLGPYAIKSPTELVMVSKVHDGATPDKAALRGIRFTVTNEVEQRMTLAEAWVKELTGGDTITGRKLYQDTVRFLPSHKLWIFGNYKPSINGTDNAIWNRVLLLEFPVSIPKAEQDEHLKEKLTLELPGILTWAVKGCLDWQAKGIAAPESVTASTEAYRSEEDKTQQFIEEECEVGVSFTCAFKALYATYIAWGKLSGARLVSARKFGDELDRLGYRTERGTAGSRRRVGLKVPEYANPGSEVSFSSE